MKNNDSFTSLNAGTSSPIIVLCDHATRHIPPDISSDDLGLDLGDLERHIAYDIGALAVARLISAYFDTKLIHTNFSRLLIDANRGENDPTLVMRLYDGTVVPGNRTIDNCQFLHRLDRFHRPYHTEIGRLIDQMIGQGSNPLLVSIHSFTPQLRGRGKRPWHIGVLWEGDDRLAQPFMQELQANTDIHVGNNEPYRGGLPGDTLNTHGLARGLPHILIEFRNDLVEDAKGQDEWARKIIPALELALSQNGWMGK